MKKNPKAFRHWLQKVDSFVEIAKHIIGDEEIGLRLHSALEADAAEYLEDIPAKTFGVPGGWRVLIQVLREKFDERRMHKVGSAMKSFFKLQVDRSWTLTELVDHMDKSACLCREAGLAIPDEILVYQFFEHSGSSMERQANLLLRTSGDYDWKKMKTAIELLYPTTLVSQRRDGGGFKGYGGGKGRSAHEAQGVWEESNTSNDYIQPDMDIEDWLFYEDPVEKLADEVPDYLPENLARELREVYATHRENRARLAKAVKARGFYVNKSKGGKKGSKGGGKSKDSGKAGKGSGGKSKGKGSGKARGMSLEQLKQVTSCADCGEMGHWRGDTQCKNPAKKAHETVNVDFEDTEQFEAYLQDYPYDDWHEWEPDTNEAWVTNKHQTWDDEKVSVSKKQTAAEAFPKLDYEEAKHVVKTVNAVKRKASEHAGSSGDVPPEQAGLTPATRPLDVFTATAQVKEQIESRKLKPVAHTATAPEAVREAFEILGVTPPPRSGSVWDCLSATEEEKTFDLDSMRISYMVSKMDPRSVLGVGRPPATVTPGRAYLTIDTACENTVGGLTALHLVAKVLEDKFKVKPTVHPEEESYRFGPGEPRISHERWHVPIGIGKKNMIIKTSTLDDRPPGQNKIPWLAGQDWLRFMAAVVDIAEQKIILKSVDAQAPLFTDHTGHLVVAVDDFPSLGWPEGKVASKDDYAGLLWLTGKAYMESAAPKTTHIYNPEDDPLATGDIYGLHPCTVHGDVWEYNMDNPLVYIRRHRRPRTTRFHPQDVVDGPEPRELQMVRVTYKDGAPEPIVDTWDQKVPWTGYTVLVGLDCEPHVQMVASTPAHHQVGVSVEIAGKSRTVHPKSLKETVTKRLQRSFAPHIKPPDLPLSRHDQRFTSSQKEFPNVSNFGSSTPARAAYEEGPIGSTPKSCSAMAAAGGEAHEALRGAAAMGECEQGGAGVQVPCTSSHGLHEGDPRRGDHLGDGPTSCPTSCFYEGEGTDSLCPEPEVPGGATQLPTSGGAWSSIWKRPWQVLGVHQLWERVAGHRLHGADQPGDGDHVQDLRGHSGQARRQGHEGRRNPQSFFFKILCLLIFLTSNIYGGSLWDHLPTSETGNYEGSALEARASDQAQEGEGQSAGLQPGGVGRRGHGGGDKRGGRSGGEDGKSFRSEDARQDDSSQQGGLPHGRVRRLNDEVKLKPGQQKRMKRMARQALATSKWQRKLIEERMKKGRWPRKHFKFDLVEVFGGTSMVSVRGSTMWRMKVLQPVDIRYGCDLR